LGLLKSFVVIITRIMVGQVFSPAGISADVCPSVRAPTPKLGFALFVGV